jgi:hypothetical protein
MNRIYPVGSWEPHKPATWPFRLATLCEPTQFREWPEHKRDAKGEPIFEYRWVPEGTKVKIVMVSRFGDVGITDDLTAENGYLARIGLEMLEKCEP